MRKIIIILLNLFAFIYINQQINSFNLLFYSGKDDGLIIRSISHILIIALSYFFLSEAQKILMFFIGILIGFVSILLSYLLFATDIMFKGFFHLFAIILSFLVFEIISRQKYLSIKNK